MRLSMFAPAKRRLSQFIVPALSGALSAAIVSGVISAIALQRIENSKERVSEIISSEQKFNASQNELFVNISIYMDALYNKRADYRDKREKLLQSIINSQ